MSQFGPASPLRVMFISASLEGGGAERQLVALANHVVGRGCEVWMTTFSSPAVRDAYHLDSRVHRLHLGLELRSGKLGAMRYCIAVCRRLRVLLKRVRPQVVVSFITSANVLTLLATRRLGMRVIVSDRAHPAADATVTRIFRALRTATYRFADTVVLQTLSAAEWTRGRLRARVLVVPNALRGLPQLSLSLPREPVLLAAGRLAHQKGFDVLLRAFALIASEFPDWNVVILGEGPERAALLAQSNALGLADRVSLPGFTSDIESWLARAGIFVLPSRFEGFPNSLLEAMGMGAAVVSSNCPSGPSELVREGENGRLVTVADVPKLAHTLSELMRDPVARERLGAAAMEVRRLYSEQSVMAQWWGILATGNRA